MRRIFFLVGLLVVSAARAKEPAEVTVYLENDVGKLSLLQSDRDYSNGMGVYASQRTSYVPKVMRDIAAAIGIDREAIDANATSGSFAFGIAQQIFTPADLDQAALIPQDRPYAGWLYLSVSFHVRTKRSQQSFVIDTGVVGPLSGASAVQRSFHALMTYRKPYGWDNQLKNEPGLTLHYRHWYRLYEMDLGPGRFFDFAPTWAVAAGNIATFASAGVRLRIGHALPDSFGPTTLAAAATHAPWSHADKNDRISEWEFSGFCGAEGRAVARDIFLDGNTFTDSHRVRKKPFLLEIEGGLVFRYQDLRLTWRLARRTADFYGAFRHHHYGSLQASYRF